jgi:ribosomal protein S18 acetylase RimI-like enzyme
MKNAPEASGTASFLHEEASFRYSIAHQDFSDEIVDVLSLAFARESMCAAVGLSPAQLRPLVARFLPECTTNGLSVIATPVDDPSTLAGVFICRDFKSPLPDGVLDDVPQLGPIVDALRTVDEAYESTILPLALGEAVDLWMVGVAPGDQFTKRGIATNLFRLCADVARERGFTRCVSECTGYYSQSAARTAGLKERARLAYRDFRFEGRATFAGIQPPHTGIVLFDKEF